MERKASLRPCRQQELRPSSRLDEQGGGAEPPGLAQVMFDLHPLLRRVEALRPPGRQAKVGPQPGVGNARQAGRFRSADIQRDAADSIASQCPYDALPR